MYGEGISRTSELVDLGVELASSTNPARGSPWAIPVWVRAAMLPSSISRIIRTSRMTYRSRSWKGSRGAQQAGAEPCWHVLPPLLCRPRRPKSLRIDTASVVLKAVSIDADDFDDLDEE